MNVVKKLNFPILVAATIALAFFIVGSFKDQSIAESIWNTYGFNIPVISLILVLAGPLITNVFGSYAGWSLILFDFKLKRKRNWIARIAGAIELLMTSYFAYSTGSEIAEVAPGITESTSNLVRILIIVFVVLFDIGMMIFVKKFNKKVDHMKLFWVAITMVVIIGGIAGSTEVVKYLASRPRPRLLHAVGNTEDYMNWWQWRPLYALINNVSESKSFISGHASNGTDAAFCIPLFLSLTKLGEKRKTAIIGVAIGSLLAFVISLSRVLASAHFVSDVAGGLFFGFLVSSIIVVVMLAIKKKVEESTPTSN